MKYIKLFEQSDWEDIDLDEFFGTNKDLILAKYIGPTGTGKSIYLIEELNDNKVTFFDGNYYGDLKNYFVIDPEIGEDDMIHIYDPRNKYPNNVNADSRRLWKKYKYEDLPQEIKDRIR